MYEEIKYFVSWSSHCLLGWNSVSTLYKCIIQIYNSYNCWSYTILYNRTICMDTLIPFKSVLMWLCYNGVCNIGHNIAQITRLITVLRLRIAMAETCKMGSWKNIGLRWQNIACLEIMYFHFYITLMFVIWFFCTTWMQAFITNI